MDYIELLREGGITIYPLLLASVVSIAIVLYKIFEFFVVTKTLKTLHPQMMKLAELRDFKKMDAALSGNIYCKNLYEVIVRNLDKPVPSIKKLSEIARSRDMAEVRRYIWLLGTIGSMAPFIGLFGTVLGIMRSFKNIASVGSGGFSVVASGISEALISTAGGLFVGVVSIFFYNYFTVKTHHIQESLRSNEEEIFVVLENQSKPR